MNPGDRLAGRYTLDAVTNPAGTVMQRSKLGRGARVLYAAPFSLDQMLHFLQQNSGLTSAQNRSAVGL